MTIMTSSYLAKGLPKKQVEVRATIRFGIITKQCKGKGICSVTVDGPDFKAQDCGYAQATISRCANNMLSIQFDKISMSPWTQKRYFSSSTFTIEEAYCLPQSITKLLEIKDNTYIDVGEYRIDEFETLFIIQFKTF